MIFSKQQKEKVMLTIEQRLRMLSKPAGKIDTVLDTDAYNEIDDQSADS